jgi:hypothetical protein
VSLIFDSFADVETAEAFRQAIERQFPGRRTHLWMDQAEMEELDFLARWAEVELEIESDVFPLQLCPPIVLVGRNDPHDDEEEREIEALVVRFGGIFAGT